MWQDAGYPVKVAAKKVDQSAAPGVLKSERRRGHAGEGAGEILLSQGAVSSRVLKRRAQGASRARLNSHGILLEDAGESGVQNEQTDKSTILDLIFLAGAEAPSLSRGLRSRCGNLLLRTARISRRREKRKEGMGTGSTIAFLDFVRAAGGMSVPGACPPFAAPHLPAATPHHPDTPHSLAARST